MAKLTVEIVTPEKKMLSVKVDEAVVPGYHGLFGVRAGHTPFLSAMEPGALTLRDGATSQVYFVAGGFVEVAQDQVTVLADAVEPASAIDVESAKKRLAEAQARLRQLSSDDVKFEIEAAIVRRETARVALANSPR